MKSKIALKKGQFSYERKVVFENIDLELQSGDLFVVLGSNGCGKTTLLRCLNGLLSLNSGQVCLDGIDISTMKSTDVARKVAMVFQEHTSYFQYSVLSVVLMGRAPHLKLFSKPSINDIDKAEQALAMVDMLDLKDTHYTRISGGEKQLVLIARSLAQQPEVLLLDEPTSHLDFRNQTFVLRIIKKLVNQGLTVVMTSHLPNQATLLAGKVGLMKNGRFVSVGKPESIFNEYSLGDLYDIEVKVITHSDINSGRTYQLCVPVL